MKRLTMFLTLLLAITIGSQHAFSQTVTITLTPGWNWISYPNAIAMEVNEALATYAPLEGDMVKGAYSFAIYDQGRWIGGLTHFMPGCGYMYYSTRSEVTSFVFTQATSSIVATAQPTEITDVSAVVGGVVTLPEGSHVFLRGVCWGTEPSPDIDGNHTSDGSGIGAFVSILEGLDIETTYHIRAYAVTDYGLAYGSDVTFTTGLVYTITATSNPEEGGEISGMGTYQEGTECTLTATPNEGYTFTNWTENGSVVSMNASYTFTVNGNRTLVANFEQSYPIGAINGLFSVSATQQVYFSQGNLQYQASTNTWKFADNQYDYVGSNNSNISSTYSGWIDLFGWGTSGWNSGNTYYHPWDYSYSWTGNLYGPPGQYDLTGSYANADWGVYNPISNGGNQTNQWRTLTQPEWNYVFNTRTTTSGIRYAKANVNNVNGVILLPDDWSSSIYSLSSTNSSVASFSSNTLTTSQWSTLEQAGAVFLPAAGIRNGTSLNGVGSKGLYWSASYSDSGNAYYVYFYDSGLGTDEFGNSDRCYGRSVRLVQDNNR